MSWIIGKNMLYWICLFCFLFTTPAYSAEEVDIISSTPDQIASLAQENSLIGGVVSPLSGQLCLRQTDLVAKGAQDVILSRTFIPPYAPFSFDDRDEWDLYYLIQHHRDNYRGWVYLPHLYLQIKPRIGGGTFVRLIESSGVTLDFIISDSRDSLEISTSKPKLTSLFGISNIAMDSPNGKYDARNTKISIEDNSNKVVVTSPDGTIRFYYREKGFLKPTYFTLLKEKLPNGKILRYTYNKYNNPICIESMDPKERYVYASISIKKNSSTETNFLTSTGQTAAYQYVKRSFHGSLKEKSGSEKSAFEYNIKSNPILTGAITPFYRHEKLAYNDRFLSTEYRGRGISFNCRYASVYGNLQADKQVSPQTNESANHNQVSHYRIDKLSFPVGNNDSFHSVYKFSYDPPIPGEKGGTTTVNNVDGSSLIYYFSKDLLMTKIQFYGTDEKLKKQKIFHWDEDHRLTSIVIKNEAGVLFYKKNYVYDNYGNPIQETLIGNLTGEGTQESTTIKREFSQDGKHLLLKEENEEGLVFCFQYLPNTNLITAKFTQDGTRILKREFFEYDDCHNLIRKIVDNGSTKSINCVNNFAGVTQRTITVCVLRKTQPFLHMSEWIEEKYLENGTEIILKRMHLTYDPYGNICQEDIYNAKGELAYSIYKEYNERGNLLSETNPLGQVATYTYDAKGQCTCSSNFSQKIRKQMQYDGQGRLRLLKEIGSDGIIHANAYRYNYNDHLIEKSDTFNNNTRFSYDPITHKVTKTDFPLISSVQGEEAISVATTSTYDILGREISKTDANGNTTHFRYNVYGSAIEIIHPDGTKENFTYTKDGKLIKHTDQEGVSVIYCYDVLGRLISKKYVVNKAKEELIAQESFTYNGFNLSEEVDKEGNVTKHTYDRAGRKIQEEFCGKIIKYQYDALGRVCTVVKQNNQDGKSGQNGQNYSNSVITKFTLDALDRVLKEEHVDILGKLLYQITHTYDEDGNSNSTIRKINGKESVENFRYDSFKRLIESKDAHGYFTTTTYNEGFINPLGQKVLQIQTVDPKKISTIATYDPFGRETKKEILNSERALISSQEMIYDPCGNLLLQKDHLYRGDIYQKTQTICYSYTALNQIKSLTRAHNTPDARTTYYRYHPCGQLAVKTNPDGKTLSYSYHPLGYMQKLKSSDAKINFSFECNRLGYLLKALDEVKKISIQRDLDPFGNILTEKLSTGLGVEKTYDKFDRTLSLKPFNQGKIDYTYDPLFLKSVTRTSGKLKYAHEYKEYDLDGNLQVESLIENLGNISYKTDLKGRKTAIESPFYVQRCSYDEKDNLIHSEIDSKHFDYTYDALSQLTSENSSEHPKAPKVNFQNYVFDSLNNRIEKNGNISEINDLNELTNCEDILCKYDLNGNVISKKKSEKQFSYTYDPLNRLTQTICGNDKCEMIYDPLGRRVSKISYKATSTGGSWKEIDRENYLYDGENEIGAFTTHGKPKQLRILGLALHENVPATVAIELEGKPFAPILDVQGNICRLIDPTTKRIAESYEYTTFGEEVSVSQVNGTTFNPWRYASKRTDPESNLVNFGKRYYDPELARWLSTDPAGFIDSMNLYTYVLNNPFRYVDPDGRFVFAIPLFVVAFELGGAAAIALPSLEMIALTATAAWVGYEVGKKIPEIQEGLDQVWSNVMQTQTLEVEIPSKTGGNENNSGSSNDSGKKKNKKNDDDNDIAKQISSQVALNGGIAASKGASNVNSSVNLKRKLSRLEGIQKIDDQPRTLTDGRIRYYRKETLSETSGPTRGSCHVVEWNKKTGMVRGWYESRDHFGNVNRVHPKFINGQVINSEHYPPTGAELIKRLNFKK